MDFNLVFKKFTSHFPPALPEESTIKLTMIDLVKVFSNFYPADFENSLLFESMIASGYKFEPEYRSGTINFYWFLKEAKFPEN